ncbi:MAG TPA: [protein-PII] uridylyltransferase [Verrucomicrobiae bacterium]|jgi:[protein-PII] uridylyltransferase|nr:[protein-PII] uridylyltransferase [Verrucomicrobiae bacterium]
MLTLLQKIEANAAARLTLSAKRSPREELPRYKNFLKVETHRLKILHRAGGEGLEICRARSAIIDLLLRYILDAVIASSPELAGKAPLFTLVATGGYGRAQLNPHSDLDIMFLHESDLTVGGKAHPTLAALVDGLLYTLWDMGLKVGHAVRSIDDCVKIANTDMQSKTSLIEARRITGDQALFDRFTKTVLSKCVLGHENEYIESRVADQFSRREKFGNSATMQEPNIKNGCGGLRDYQNLLWMAYFKYRTRSLSELQEKDMISAAEAKQLDRAYSFLLRVRNELHYAMNRSADILGKSVQPSVASSLGYHERSASERLEVFMGDFYGHTRNIDLITRTVERRLALFPPPRSVLSPLRRIFRVGRRKEPEPPVDGFKFVDDEILPASSTIFRDKPRRLMRVFLVAQQRGLKLHPDMAQLIRNQLSLVNNSFLRDEHVRESFLEILDQRGAVAPALRAMHEVGFLGKFMPEFGRLTCLVQHEFYHQYTADEHTLVCLQRLDEVWNATKTPFANYAEIFREVERGYVLYLALLLHDSGKAYRTGKHEQVGGDLALRVAQRLGLDGAKAHTLRLIIESHLAMAQISQRRDLDDPTVIKSFARQIQNMENLNMLTLHTFADSMGTSSQLWNGFKDAALTRLYQKTREQLTGGTEFRVAEARQRELLMDEVKRMAPPTFDPHEIQAHFNNVPARYAQINDAHEILRDISQVHRFIQLQLSDKEENALAPIVSWHNEPDRGYTTVSICTWDRERLFSKIAGCLTASGLNILSAEIVTRHDGVILDIFTLTDAKTASLAKKEERETFEDLLHKVLTGAPVDLAGLIAKTKAVPTAYKSIEGERIPTTVLFDNEISDNRTVIDIQTEDRVGLLYDISRALASVAMNISLAKITTEKGAAMDSFYVTEHNGSKILNLAREQAIRDKLLHYISGASRPAPVTA